MSLEVKIPNRDYDKNIQDYYNLSFFCNDLLERIENEKEIKITEFSNTYKMRIFEKKLLERIEKGENQKKYKRISDELNLEYTIKKI